MPELPEVETVMRELSPLLLGNKLVSVTVRSPSLRILIPKKSLSSLVGSKVLRLSRRAKYILIDFSSGQTLLIHLGMTGTFDCVAKDKFCKNDMDRHDHVVLETDKGRILVYRDPRRFGLLEVMPTAQVVDSRWLAKLGPEPLDAGFTAEVLQERLRKRSGPIKPAIMDQSVVVGVGNIYASEALFLSRIHPATPASGLSRKQAGDLVSRIKEILTAAIAAGGSTINDYHRLDGGSGYFQFDFSVYDRAGMACPDCTCSLKRTGGIARIVQAGRSTFFCPTRQKSDKIVENPRKLRD